VAPKVLLLAPAPLSDKSELWLRLWVQLRLRIVLQDNRIRLITDKQIPAYVFFPCGSQPPPPPLPFSHCCRSVIFDDIWGIKNWLWRVIVSDWTEADRELNIFFAIWPFKMLVHIGQSVERVKWALIVLGIFFLRV
jgi:hypothetical protein